MAIREHKPTTNGRRNMTSSDFVEITKKRPERALLESQSHTAGHNSYDHITIRYRGGGRKQKYRIIDFKCSKNDVKAVVKAIKYDPDRIANIALLHYTDGIKTYILASKGLKVGDTVESGVEADIKPGNALLLANILTDTSIHNIELKPGKGGQLVRSAGTEGQVPGTDGRYILMRLQSGEVRRILSTCRATIGVVGNEQHSLIQLGKAGRKRWLGKHPQSRDSVVNPNDHPHGGGEGKAPIGRPQPTTPWGKRSCGIKTRSTKKASERVIIRHRKGNR